MVWSYVEAGVAVIAACLPTIRPLFDGKSPESLLGSLRSMISLSSLRLHDHKRGGSDNEALRNDDGLNLDHVNQKETSVETQITGNYSDHKSVGENQILMQNGLSFKEERVGDMTV